MQEKLDSVILYQIDCEKGDGIELKKNYKIKGYPTFVLASKEGETYYRWWGYSKDMLFTELDAGFADLTTISDKEKRYAKKPDGKTAKSLASYYQTQGEIKKAVALYNAAAEYDKENTYASELFSLYASGYRRNVYSLDDVMIAADKALASSNDDEELKLSVYAQMSSYIKDSPENEKLLAFASAGYTFIQNTPGDVPKWAKNAIELNYTLFVKKDTEISITIKKSTFKEGWENDPGALNNFSWWCFENKINLQEAEELGRRGVKLAPPGREKAMILDTVAEIVNLRGNPKEAVTLMEEAIKEDPGTENWKKQLERFKKELNKT